jgi:dCTP deaminase
MSVLSDRDIEKELRDKRLVIDPSPKRINPASVELTLGEEIVYLKRTLVNEIDLRKPFPEDTVDQVIMTKKVGFRIKPGEHYLATTAERIELPNDIAVCLIGKSSVGRVGLVPVTANYIDPGFSGHMAFQIYNVGHTPVIIYPGMFLAQGVFYYLNTPAKNPYNKRPTSLYHGQKSTTLPKTSNLFPSDWKA